MQFWKEKQVSCNLNVIAHLGTYLLEATLVENVQPNLTTIFPYSTL